MGRGDVVRWGSGEVGRWEGCGEVGMWGERKWRSGQVRMWGGWELGTGCTNYPVAFPRASPGSYSGGHT